MRQYKVLRPFCQEGKVRKAGETIAMHERQARYLVMGSQAWVEPVREAEVKAEPAEAKRAPAAPEASEPKWQKAKKKELDEPNGEEGVTNA